MDGMTTLPWSCPSVCFLQQDSREPPRLLSVGNRLQDGREVAHVHGDIKKQRRRTVFSALRCSHRSHSRRLPFRAESFKGSMQSG